MGRCYVCGVACEASPTSSGVLPDGTHLHCERKMWASNRRNGFVIALMLLPIALVGFLVGIVFSALRAGFEEGSGIWKTVFGFIQKPRP
jgi:hypothetical protein